jgi:SAM-dependent methyltransferase
MHEHVSEAAYDQRYRSHAQLWSGNPNPHLVSEVSDLTPGSALDVGCGEGADAIWLAEHGWRVTAVDFSMVALERAAARAAELGADVSGRIEWLRQDLTKWTPTEASYDLVSAQFFQLPKMQREVVFPSLAAAVAPGGTLLIVGHHPSDLQVPNLRAPMAELYFTAEEIAAAILDSRHWETLLNVARERSVTDAEGRTVIIHDAVLRARRREKQTQV